MVRPGRPPEGRVKVTWYVKPLTRTRVEFLMDRTLNTPGKVIDAQFGVGAKTGKRPKQKVTA